MARRAARSIFIGSPFSILSAWRKNRCRALERGALAAEIIMSRACLRLRSDSSCLAPGERREVVSFPLFRGNGGRCLAISRQSRRLPLIARMRLIPGPGFVISLNSSLPPIDGRLHFCQTHEAAAEAARSRIAEAQGDLRYALAGFQKQIACGIEAHFRDHVTVAGAHSGEMTLQRARTHPQLACRVLKRCVTMA